MHVPVLLLVLQSLHKALPSTTLYYKACTKHFLVLLCTTKLAQRTFQCYYFVLQSLHKTRSRYYFVLQSLHNARSSTITCTTKLAQNTFQYYFVLQSLHKTLPSTTLYYKACTKHFPVLLCTTKLAQSTSRYYFVLQSLHKALPSTTLYYKACTMHVPVLLLVLQSLHKALLSTTFCTTKLAQSTFQYYFVLQSLHKALPCATTLCHEDFTHSKLFKQRSFYSQKLLHTTSFYTEKLLYGEAFKHSKRLHTERFYTECFFTHGKRLHTQKLLQRKAFTHTEKPLHTASFYFLHKIFYTQQAFTVQKNSFYTEKLSCTQPQQELQVENQMDPGAKSTATTVRSAVPFIAGCNHFTGKNARFRAIYAHGNTRWQQSCSHSNATCHHKIQETHRTTHTDATTRCRTRRRNQFADETTPAAPAAHRRYLSSPAATALQGKTHGFVLRLPPHHKPHATIKQPSQCVL